MRRISLIFYLFVASPAVFAEWSLNNAESTISFTSTKANVAAEVHGFGELIGQVSPSGAAEVEIRLDSVDTAIEIRDQRMREMLFETGSYPTAEVRMNFEPEIIAELAPGDSITMTTEAELDLHGTTTPVTVTMEVAKLSDSRLLVTSKKPVIINASQVGLLDGVEKLREVAGLASISPAVPVTFVLIFDRDPKAINEPT